MKSSKIFLRSFLVLSISLSQTNIFAMDIQPSIQSNKSVIVYRYGDHIISNEITNPEEFVQNFIQKVGDVNSFDFTGQTLLHYAAVYKNSELIKTLVKFKADLEIRTLEFKPFTHGRTPLHCAATSGNYEAVEELIRLGANVNAIIKTEQDSYQNGQTPLHAVLDCLAKISHIETIRILLENRANLDEKDDNGKTPIDVFLQKKESLLFLENLENLEQLEQLFKKHGAVFPE